MYMYTYGKAFYNVKCLARNNKCSDPFEKIPSIPKDTVNLKQINVNNLCTFDVIGKGPN